MAYWAKRYMVPVSRGPGRGMSGLSSQPPGRPIPRSLGSLGADDPNAGSTLSTPTITDPTLQWQADVLAQLRSGVDTLRTAELQKWLQIVATLSIPLAAAVWKSIFKRGAKDPTI